MNLLLTGMYTLFVLTGLIMIFAYGVLVIVEAIENQIILPLLFVSMGFMWFATGYVILETNFTLLTVLVLYPSLIYGFHQVGRFARANNPDYQPL